MRVKKRKIKLCSGEVLAVSGCISYRVNKQGGNLFPPQNAAAASSESTSLED